MSCRVLVLLIYNDNKLTSGAESVRCKIYKFTNVTETFVDTNGKSLNRNNFKNNTRMFYNFSSVVTSPGAL